jgi:hypothetical protein
MSIDAQLVTNLIKDVQSLVTLFGDRHVSAFYASNALIGVAILSSVGVVIAGMYDAAKVAALLGLLVTTIISADTIWAPGEKAQFWREVEAEARNLSVDLRDVGTDSDKYAKAVAVFKVLNSQAAKNIPRGGGMEALKKFYTDLQSRN